MMMMMMMMRVGLRTNGCSGGHVARWLVGGALGLRASSRAVDVKRSGRLGQRDLSTEPLVFSCNSKLQVFSPAVLVCRSLLCWPPAVGCWFGFRFIFFKGDLIMTLMMNLFCSCFLDAHCFLLKPYSSLWDLRALFTLPPGVWFLPLKSPNVQSASWDEWQLLHGRTSDDSLTGKWFISIEPSTLLTFKIQDSVPASVVHCQNQWILLVWRENDSDSLILWYKADKTAGRINAGTCKHLFCLTTDKLKLYVSSGSVFRFSAITTQWRWSADVQAQNHLKNLSVAAKCPKISRKTTRSFTFQMQTRHV